MDESEIEGLLSKVRPVGPSAQLRQRILAASPVRPIWPWFGAAAAALIATMALNLAAGYEIGRADLRTSTDADGQIAGAIADMLGGDARARRIADFLLQEQSAVDDDGDYVQRLATLEGDVR